MGVDDWAILSIVHVRFLVLSVGQSSCEGKICSITYWDVFFSENDADPVIDESFSNASTEF